MGEEALQDCKKAISFDPDYSKAYSRMGLIYSKINLFAESENCYEKALKLEPDNESYKKNIQIVKDKLKEQAGNPMAAMQGMPGMPGAGGMPDFAQMGAAMENLMQNPEMQNMMQNMMGGGMPGMGGMPGAEAGGMPGGMPGMEGFNPAAMQAGMQMAQQMMQSIPDAVEEMRKEFMKQMGGGQK